MISNSKEKKSEPCHWLPCSIEYNGVAPVNVFFRPEYIHIDNDDGDNHHLKVKGEKDEKCVNIKLEERPQIKRGRKRKTIEAASFRGRGLLAKQPIALSEQNIVGSVLTFHSPSSSSTTASKCNIEIGEQFSEVHEWEHEWDVNKVAKVGRCVGRRGGVTNGIEFLQVLRSVRSRSII